MSQTPLEDAIHHLEKASEAPDAPRLAYSGRFSSPFLHHLHIAVAYITDYLRQQQRAERAKDFASHDGRGP